MESSYQCARSKDKASLISQVGFNPLSN